MEKQLINLALLNGGSLSEKTKTNLDLYLRTKLQSAGSGDLSVSGDQDQGGDDQQSGLIGNLFGAMQNINSTIAQTATGINVDEMNAKIDNLNSLFGLIGASQDEIEALKQEVGNDFGEITESINDLETNVAELKQRLDSGAIESQKLSESLVQLEDHIKAFLTEIDRLNQKIDDEVLRATKEEKKEIEKRHKVTQQEAKIRKRQNVKLTKRLQKAEQKIAENKRDLTSSIDKLSTSVNSLEADYQTQGVINQEMVNVLRKLNKENIESQEKFRKLKKTPFGAFI